MTKTTPSPEYGGRAEQSARLGFSTTTFDRLSRHPNFPKPINALPGKPLYRNADVDRALVQISDEREAALIDPLASIDELETSQ